MNMVSIRGVIKNTIIGWDTIPEIYTEEELRRRISTYLTMSGSPEYESNYVETYLQGVLIRRDHTVRVRNVYYYGKKIYSFS